jgi:hypothetical protein
MIPPPAPAAPAAPDASKWVPVIYGFVEADALWDSTQSFNDLAGNTPIARKGSYAGDNGRFTFGVRNSRVGFKLAAPEFHGVKASAVIEMDFLGNQPAGTSEGAIFTSPLMRMRHANFKVETPVVDILMGQTWQLFGWQPYFHPSTVEIQGVPGQIYSRTPQLRLSHVFKSDAVNLELAVAAVRPVQRDSSLPDGQAGLRLLVNKWKGLRTTGSTGTAIDSAAIGVSGLLRSVKVPELSGSPKSSTKKGAWGVSADAMLPLIPATAENRSNALTLTGSFVSGAGIADLYTGLNGGIGFPVPPNPMMASPAPTYNSTIDAGVVSFTAGGKPEVIKWQSFIVGLQYYTPIDNGHVWLAANYSQMRSANADDFATASTNAKIFERSQYANGDLFWDVTDKLRFGLDFSWYWQKYVDGVKANDKRVQFSGFYLF